MEIYKPKYFEIHEFVPEIIYLRRGELAWELLDEKLTKTWDEVREMRGKSYTLNDYKWGGSRHQQGLRTADYYGKKGSNSQHLYGRAGDGKEKGYTSIKEIVEFLRTAKSLGALEYLTGIEVGVTWLHLDTRPCDRLNKEGLFFFDKKGVINIEEYVWPSH